MKRLFALAAGAVVSFALVLWLAKEAGSSRERGGSGEASSRLPDANKPIASESLHVVLEGAMLASRESELEPATADAALPEYAQAGESARRKASTDYEEVLAQRQVEGPGLEVSGIVRDDLGNPIEHFSISAAPGNQRALLARPPHPPRWPHSQAFGKHFSDELGRFALAGFSNGTWQVKAHARDHDRSTIVLDVPDDLGKPLVFVLPRAGAISGIVLDPHGLAVHRAEVVLSESKSFSEPDSLPEHWATRRTHTDKSGRFDFDDVRLGRVALAADSDRYLPSAQLMLDVAPGATLEGIELVLEVGGRITGEVAGLSGTQAACREVELRGAFLEMTLADLDGNFAFEGLPPGEYTLRIATTRDEVVAVFGDDAGEELPRFLDRTGSVTLAERESVHVVLELPALAPVRLHGRILAGDKPLAGARLETVVEPRRGILSTTTDDHGRYGLTLPDPGRYVLSISGKESGFHFATTIDVPESAESQAFDLAIPTGTISGRVTGPDGEPLAGISLSLGPEDRSWRAASCMSGEDGRYIAEVAAGTYTISTSVDPFGTASFPPGYLEHVFVEEGAHLEGIDIELRNGGSLEGVVSDDGGNPLSGIRIGVHELERDAPVLFFGGRGVSDQNGRFHIDSVAPGLVLVTADHERLAFRPMQVEIRAGEVEHVRLEMIPGTRLFARAMDASGLVVQAGFELVDSSGVSLQIPNAPLQDGRQRLGTVPLGTYSVRARVGDQVAESTVSVAGDEQTLELRID